MADIVWQAMDSRSPGSAVFSQQVSQATEVFYCAGQDIQDAVLFILGSTKAAGDGKLNRKLPKAHFAYPFLYASSVRVTPLGTDDHFGNEGEVIDSADDLEAPIIVAQYYRYALAMLSVEFTIRPYALLSDDSIPVGTVNYYNTDGTSASATYAEEWRRYTDIEYNPSPELAFAQQGNNQFYTGSGNPPGGFTMSGFPRFTIPKAAVALYAYEFPFDYLLNDNSVLVEFVGRINQLDWFGWPKGTLLYLGVKVVRRYTPPFPDKELAAGGNVYSTAKNCDMVLNFEETVRTTTDAPTYGAGNTNTTVSNHSYIIDSGHNLQPFFGGKVPGTNTTVARGFYYSGTPNNAKTPIYDSAPFQLLLTDPDVLP